MSKRNVSRINSIISRMKALANITDNFTRSNSTGLGTASGNASAIWSATSGSFDINTNKAYAASPSTNPIATLTFSKDSMTISADTVAGGMGTVFWVTDANNWWGTYLDITQSCSTCYNAQNCSAYQQQVYYSFAGYNNGYYAYTPTTTYTCPPGWQSGIPWIGCSYAPKPPYYRGCCCTWVPAQPKYTTTYYYSCSAYNASTSYSCNCVNNYSVKLIKKIAGTITQLTSFAMTSAIVGIQTVFNSSTGAITVRGFSGSGYTSQVGSDQSTTVSGFTATKKHGIMGASVSYAPSQGYTIGSMKVE